MTSSWRRRGRTRARSGWRMARTKSIARRWRSWSWPGWWTAAPRSPASDVSDATLRLHLVAKHAIQDLSHRTGRQGVAELDLLGPLVFGEVSGAVGLELCFRGEHA